MPEQIKIERCDWAAILVAALLILGPLSWPLIHHVWQPEAQNQADGGQPYQRIQTIVAGFSALVSFLTLGAILFQASIARGQAEISRQQTDIQRAQHVALNRPRLIVREVERRDSRAGGRIFVSFHVVNIGGGDARPSASVRRNHILSKRRGPFSIFPVPINGPNGSLVMENFLGSDTLSTQEERVFDDNAGATEIELGQIEARWTMGQNTDDIWVFHGTIYYADLNGAVYRTSFWREYNFETRRFVATDNTEYEHSY